MENELVRLIEEGWNRDTMEEKTMGMTGDHAQIYSKNRKYVVYSRKTKEVVSRYYKQK